MSYPQAAVDAAFLLLPTKMDSRQARIVHAAIGFQESGFLARRQIITVTRDGKKVNVPEGPAMGFWQFESGGGVKGVMAHSAVSEIARRACHSRGVPFVQDAAWRALEEDDVLAAVFARLLMWADSAPLPVTPDAAWAMYARTWRPGKPHPDKWPSSWASAMSAV